MSTAEPFDEKGSLERIRSQVAAGTIYITRHALGEMNSRGISLTEIGEALASGEVLENYPEHQRGPCCLVNGTTVEGRDLHIVCTTTLPTLIIITAYQPQMPKWKTPRERNR